MNILAIRGGGSRGVIVTRFLMEIEKLTGIRISKLFDYVGGSSVGCLIASGILMSNDDGTPKYTAKDMHDILINNMTETFSWTYSSWLLSGFGLFGSSYTNVGLLNIINNLCGEAKLKTLLKPIIFPAYDRLSHRAYYFEREKDGELFLKDVIMSCTAAPTYFPSHKMEINNKTCDMVDGGLVINNTVELAFLSATKHMTCIDKSKILELNIGTGAFENIVSDSHGLLTWAPVIVTTLMHANNENGLYELSLSLPPENYCIFDIPLDFKYYTVDDIKSTPHYIKETEKWIVNNKQFIREFCVKLMLNKGFDIVEMCERINEEDLMNGVNENNGVNDVNIVVSENINGDNGDNVNVNNVNDVNDVVNNNIVPTNIQNTGEFFSLMCNNSTYDINVHETMDNYYSGIINKLKIGDDKICSDKLCNEDKYDEINYDDDFIIK